ncbi:glycoside hydrolase family 2 TIM barrel-domain containing protein [Bogoriella caseilytica]|uniref:Beta-galactosidase n=1 Tax=Bogoriella caseilytica TaxID=56055 RepID=A0A3N2BCX6_9MICO|nr:glycoside hydrolase family 2 TIM barrel-domain containing protein [Bogoriella caseilytica]ROR73099.1 beta-galactosidase [Bogoriella caseilytica]
MRTPAYLTDHSPGYGALPPRARLDSNAPELDLTGTWDFRLHQVAEPGMAPWEDDDAAPWDSLELPCHWVLAGDGAYGRPAYTNVVYPFPVEPPFVPDANPTGDHRRTFTLPDAWQSAERLLLRFDGVESAYRVWLNGTEIGVGKGSRLVHEFDVTDAVAPGENVLAVRVHQWSDATYLEDQDQWWLPGIFRDITLLARPAAGIHDLWLRAGYDHVTGRGSLVAEVDAAAAAFPLRLRIPELGVDVTWASSEEIAPLTFPAVEPWTAETPRRYGVELHSQGEQVRVHTGFRTVSIEGDQFLVNGRKVMFRGVNRHEIEASRGRVFDRAHAREDLLEMKRHNVNAIRTSHYPPHPGVLDLADELGFWVIDECDLETHGFYLEGWEHTPPNAPADDPRWREAHLDRITRTVERDKNHPCVVIWSLGNETGTGQNMAAMAHWVHSRDPERPVHYEGDYWGEYTDIYSRMYTQVTELKAIGGDTGDIAYVSPGAADRLRAKPFLLCEYIHAMGNGPGGIADYDAVLRAYPRLHGGFVWEWRDHGLLTTTEDGTSFYGYGGDFGEELHDGNFVTDGLLLSDGTPSPGLKEFAAVVAPVVAVLHGEGEDTVVTVTNDRHTADTSDLQVRWIVLADGEEHASGLVDLAAVPAGERAKVALPEELRAALRSAGETLGVGTEEIWLTLQVEQAGPTEWAPAGHVISARQRDLSDSALTGRSARVPAAAALPRTGRAEPVIEEQEIVLGPGRFDARTGALNSLGGVRVSGPAPELWRAPTDNDRGGESAEYEDVPVGQESRARGESVAERWERQGLNRLHHRVLGVRAEADRLVVRWRSAAAASTLAIETVFTYLVTGQGELGLHVSISADGRWPGTWPRVGVRLTLPAELSEATWHGTGPEESYPDTDTAALVGRYRRAIDELGVEYAKPQETGHRPELRELELAGGGTTVGVRSFAGGLGAAGSAVHVGRPGFTVSRHTAQELTAATHPHTLPPSSGVHLYLDAAQYGIGTGSCGPGVLPSHQLVPGSYAFAVALRAQG